MIRDVVKALLITKGSVEITLDGRCMEPFLISGDKALIRSGQQIHTGDICLIAPPNNDFALHRIVDIDNDVAFTKGDFSGKGEIVPLQSILGVACAFQLKDMDKWSDYDSPPELKKHIAALSMQLCPRPETNRRDREETRARLSKILHAERQRLTSEEACHAKADL